MALKSHRIHVIMSLYDLSFCNKLRKNLILLFITFLEFIVPDSKTVKLKQAMMTLTSYEFVLFNLSNRKYCWLIFMTHQCTIHNILMKQFQNVKYILYIQWKPTEMVGRTLEC